MDDFSGKKFLITGASSGLGLVMAQEFERMGGKLAMVARSHDRLEKLRTSFSNPDEHVSLTYDFRELDGIDSLCEQVMDFHKDIDVILHVAGGGFGLRSLFPPAKEFMDLFCVNVIGAMEINRFLVPVLQKKQSGNVLHIGSTASVEAVGSLSYNTAKAALAAYVRSLGRELAKDHVIATGLVMGGFMAPDNAFARLKTRNQEAFDDFVQNRLPFKELPDASEMMPMIRYMCSKDARMLSGAMVPFDAAELKSYSLY